MKLKNKKTGEIVEPVGITCINDRTFVQFKDGKGTFKYEAGSLAELNEEWEDYTEPKGYWYIDYDGRIHKEDHAIEEEYKDMVEIGNYFETREDAEKAVEKLKAWKRLKDKGFKFDHIRSIDGVSIKHKDLDQFTIIAYADEDGCDQECLDLLFSGEDD